MAHAFLTALKGFQVYFYSLVVVKYIYIYIYIYVKLSLTQTSHARDSNRGCSFSIRSLIVVLYLIVDKPQKGVRGSIRKAFVSDESCKKKI